MSPLSSFIISRVVEEIEKQFVSHLPEIQPIFVNEVSELVKVVSDWVESKMNFKGESLDEKKTS